MLFSWECILFFGHLHAFNNFALHTRHCDYKIMETLWIVISFNRKSLTEIPTSLGWLLFPIYPSFLCTWVPSHWHCAYVAHGSARVKSSKLRMLSDPLSILALPRRFGLDLVSCSSDQQDCDFFLPVFCHPVDHIEHRLWMNYNFSFSALPNLLILLLLNDLTGLLSVFCKNSSLLYSEWINEVFISRKKKASHYHEVYLNQDSA